MNRDCVKRRPFNWLVTRQCKLESQPINGYANQYTLYPVRGITGMDKLGQCQFMDEVIAETEAIIKKNDGGLGWARLFGAEYLVGSRWFVCCHAAMVRLILLSITSVGRMI